MRGRGARGRSDAAGAAGGGAGSRRARRRGADRIAIAAPRRRGRPRARRPPTRPPPGGSLVDRVVDRRDGGDRDRARRRSAPCSRCRRPAPTWSADTAASSPTTPARWRARARPRARPAGRRTPRTSSDAWTNASAREADGGEHEPERDRRARRRCLAGERRDQRRDRDHARGRGQRRQPGLERAHPERRRVLEVQAEHVHQRVDRAGDDQDRQRRADEHAVAQQLAGRRAAPSTRRSTRTNTNVADDRDREAAERRGRGPAPVVALAEREHERHEHERDQHRAGPVDRARARSGRATPGRCAASAGCRRPRSRRRSRTGPASRWCRRARRRRSGPSAAPAADAAPQSVIAFICPAPDAATDSRLMPQARIVAPAAPWIIRPPTTPAAAGRQRDQHARGDEQREPAEEDLAAPEHVAERARGDDHRGADERVAGHRPLQLRDRRVDVLADRRQQDRHRRRVRVDDERRDARGGEDAARPPAGRARPRPSVLERVVGLQVVDLVLESCSLSGQ